MTGNSCSAPNCSNNRKKGWRLFTFPKQEERCQKWIQTCGRSDLIGKTTSYLNANCTICSAHFEISQFMNPTNSKCRLIETAVPTLFDVPNPPKPLTTKSKRKLPERKETPRCKSQKKNEIPNASLDVEGISSSEGCVENVQECMKPFSEITKQSSDDLAQACSMFETAKACMKKVAPTCTGDFKKIFDDMFKSFETSGPNCQSTGKDGDMGTCKISDFMNCLPKDVEDEKEGCLVITSVEKCFADFKKKCKSEMIVEKMTEQQGKIEEQKKTCIEKGYPIDSSAADMKPTYLFALAAAILLAVNL